MKLSPMSEAQPPWQKAVQALEARLTALEGRLSKLESEVTKTPIQIGLQRFPVEHSSPTWPRAVIDSVADYFGFPTAWLFTRSRRREIVWPRQLAQWALVTLGMSPTAVDGLFAQSRGAAKHAFRRVVDSLDKAEIKQRDAVWRLAVPVKWPNAALDPSRHSQKPATARQSSEPRDLARPDCHAALTCDRRRKAKRK